MKNLLLIVALLGGFYVWFGNHHTTPGVNVGATPTSATASSFDQSDSHRQIQGEGVVIKVLPDDVEGSQHQKFLLKLASGQVILVAHNIDIAPRIPNLSRGDMVAFKGEYIWNEKGGLVHWTHHDPSGRHDSGWLKRDGQTYE